MSVRQRGGALALAITVLTTSAAADAQSFPTDDAIRSILEARISEGRGVGLVVGVLDSDGSTRVVYAGNAGANARPLGERTLFEIGSITKVFTGALLAEMVRRGEVELTDPVARYLPDGVRVPSRGGREITLLDLATHRSGLPRLPTNFAPADPRNPYADYTTEQMYAFLASYELPRDVGASAEYSNLGVGLLGHALARAAGTSYEEALRTRILEPLGLGRTASVLNGELREWLAQGHDPTGTPVSHWDLPTLAGAGALRSDVHDLLYWLAANTGEPASDLEGSLRVAQQRRAAFSEGGGPAMEIGLGWILQGSGDSRIVWHNGGTGGFYSFHAFDPVRRVGVVVLANAAHPIDDIGMHLLDSRNPLNEPARGRVQVEVAPEILRDYVGEYQLAPQFSITVTLENDALFIQATNQPRFPILSESESRFFLRVVDAQITFQRDESGAVTGLVLHQGGRDVPGTKVR